MCYYVGGVGLIKDLMLYIIIPTVLTTAAGYMINDHLDQGRDEVNQKKSRKINFGKGLYFYYVLFQFDCSNPYLYGWDRTIFSGTWYSNNAMGL